ncbi:hypothetical protein BGZ95_001546 [Linnemannia exigua]|uniref:Uncharacterized protein n=1 Tax=Linnemannia exigua TaxID=604196 RepID=A0AAD4D8W3_9FUNG|nr:hypothetical protein BGZ95_001546 [Linnemannia exigua]
MSSVDIFPEPFDRHGLRLPERVLSPPERIGALDLDGSRVAEVWTGITANLFEIVFASDLLTIKVVSTIVFHQATLVIVEPLSKNPFGYEADVVALVSAHFTDFNPLLELIPRGYRYLKIFIFKRWT